MTSAESDLKQKVGDITTPQTGYSIADIGRVARLDVDGGKASVEIELGFPAASLHQEIVRLVTDTVSQHPGVDQVDVALTTRITPHGVQRNLKPLDEVKNVIAIASGKGGVGKSTTAVNLALALAAEGARVGILDADIYGPSVPTMLGVADSRPTSDDGKSMNPLTAYDVQLMSIGLLIDADQPMVWRGPMVTQALNQLLQQTRWSGLDYLIVDMPPGTGDIQLTLSQQVPVSGAVIVTTPQDIALLDARKGLQMFRKVSIPVLGVIENMSLYVCPECGYEETLFGAGGGERMAADYDVELLGALPLERNIREQTDGGQPTVVADPDSKTALAYRVTAMRMAARLAMQDKDYSRHFPKIVVENQ